MLELIGYIALIVLGLVLGNFGMGGSMLAVPILVYAFSLNVVTASAYTLFMIGATSLAGFGLKRSDNLVDLRAATFFGIPSLLAIFFARRWIVVLIPDSIPVGGTTSLTRDDVLLMLLCLLMTVSSVMMIKGKQNTVSSKPVKEGLLIPVGAFSGFVCGIVGVGGGFLILPSLVLLGGIPMRTAVGTTLVIISLNSLLGFFGDVMNQHIEWSFLLMITGFCLAGLFMGYLVRRYLALVVAQRLIGWILAVAVIVILACELTSHQSN